MSIRDLRIFSFTMADLISFSRVPMALRIVWIFWQHGQATWETLFWAVIFAITDGLDGALARKYGWHENPRGGRIDEVCDKIGMFLLMSYFAVSGKVWWLWAGLMIMRDVVITLFRSNLKTKYSVSLPARKLGKVKTGLQFGLVIWTCIPYLEMTTSDVLLKLLLTNLTAFVATMVSIVAGVSLVRFGLKEKRRYS